MGVVLVGLQIATTLIPDKFITCKVMEFVLLSAVVGVGLISFIVALLVTKGIPMSQFLALIRRRGGTS